MTKTVNPQSLISCQKQQLWLFPELQDWHETYPKTPSIESSKSTEPSKRSNPSTPNSSSPKIVQVAIGESGRPVGESAPNAKYTDDEIDQVFTLRSQGYFYREISEMMDMPIRTIRTVLDGSRRNKHIVGWKKLKRLSKKCEKL